MALENLTERPLEAVYDQILSPALAEAEWDWHLGKLDDARHLWIRLGIKAIVHVRGELQQGEDNEAASNESAVNSASPLESTTESAELALPELALPELALPVNPLR